MPASMRSKKNKSTQIAHRIMGIPSTLTGYYKKPRKINPNLEEKILYQPSSSQTNGIGPFY